ncbi:M48 family metalloprotease [Flammeovirgaceae bacterium SG7u.111]|nr:M48 family metalloprotease [Flammeovirgaceae bacterium SG7u.132]WPO36262.1 M48 family metalloprotease [Flammeovirgaceae bacterium SG7u.111]
MFHTSIQKIIAFSIKVVFVLFSFLFVPKGFAQSIELDKQLGIENAKIVEEQMGIVDDSIMTAYVSSVGNRLVSALVDPMFEFHFHIVDDPVPNAFALPGGYVYVTRGILSLVATEDELACVMAHEIVHVLRRHSIKQMRKSILPQILELPGRVVGVVNQDLGNILSAPIKAGNSLFLASYSRKHENEADEHGVAIASKAGYDPNALKPILTRISAAVELMTNEQEKKSYFDDHPFTPKRVSNINKTVEKLTWEETPNLSLDFPKPIDGLIYGESPRLGIFKENVFMHPEMGFAITFPKGWNNYNQPTTVSALNKDGTAGVFLGLIDTSKTPEEYAKEFEAVLAEKYANLSVKSRPYEKNGNKGYLVSVDDTSGEEVIFIHFCGFRWAITCSKSSGLRQRKWKES